MKKCDGNHSAAENARCFDIECWDDVNRAFNIWWHNEGSGMPPRRDEDAYEHVHRVAQIAWSNGYYTANYGMNELQERVKFQAESLDRYENGFQGACYCCETVGMKNIELKAKVDRTCTWKRQKLGTDWDEYDSWGTSCGEDFAIVEEWHDKITPYCSNCGGKVIEQALQEGE